MHHDQAQTLRRLFTGRKSEEPGAGADPTVLVVSGVSERVGTSVLVASLGSRLARAGLRVLLIDRAPPGRSTGLGALLEPAPGICVLSAQEPAEGACAGEYDVILIDTGVGTREGALALHHPRFTSVVILTPEPAALADAYGLVKGLRNRRGITRASVIVNSVTDGREGQRAYQGLASVSDRFLDIQLDYLGHCVLDEKITQPVLNGKFLLNLDREARSFPCLELLSKRIHTEFAERLLRVGDRSVCRNMSGFWGTFTEVSK